MNKRKKQADVLEARLRGTAAQLRPPDPARVAAACARAAEEVLLSPLRESRTFTRPLLRVAACLALLLGLAVLTRPLRQNPAVATTLAVQPQLPSLATFGDFAELMGAQELAASLVFEADNLSSDFADLTAQFNASTFSILF